MPDILQKRSSFDLILLSIILIWGINFPIIKHVLELMHPFVLNVFRFSVSIAALGLVILFQQKKRDQNLIETLRLNFKVIGILGLLGYFLYQIFFILGLNDTTAGNTALIMASSPAWTAICGVLFTNERLSNSSWLGLFLSIVGTVVIISADQKEFSTSDEYLTGNLLILIAAMCWGVYTAFSKPVTKKVDPVMLTFGGLVLMFPLNALIAFPYLSATKWEQFDGLTILAIIYSGSLSTGIAVVLWIYAVRQVGATYTAVYGNLVPVVALISSFILLQEKASFMQLLGGGIVIGGLLLMRYTKNYLQKN